MKTPSSNWITLQKSLPTKNKRKTSDIDAPRKRRKLSTDAPKSSQETSSGVPLLPSVGPSPRQESSDTVSLAKPDRVNGESRAALRNMVVGHDVYSEAHRRPGKYLALDCEMVGVGPEGVESSLARVSLVNFYGYVILDAFVKQRERVVDYRTQWSGIRSQDMEKAKPFMVIQKEVAALLEGKFLIGHAVYNDLKALLLSHPRSYTRDTQYYSAKSKLMPSSRPALRNLVLQELGIAIQEGEHSSVTDARATMAVYRLHRKEWEKGFKLHSDEKEEEASKEGQSRVDEKGNKGKQKLQSTEERSRKSERQVEPPPTPSQSTSKPEPGETTTSVTHNTKSKSKSKSTSFPGGGRKGVSSGLGSIVRRGVPGKGIDSRRGSRAHPETSSKSEWWKELPSSGKAPKGTISIGTHT